MFGELACPPPNSNIFPLIWSYIIKKDGTKIFFCVCNDSPTWKGYVTLDYTYAAALENLEPILSGLSLLSLTTWHLEQMPLMYLRKPLVYKRHSTSPSRTCSNRGGKRSSRGRQSKRDTCYQFTIPYKAT